MANSKSPLKTSRAALCNIVAPRYPTSLSANSVIRHRQVAVMFAEERPFLLPVPLEPFRYYQNGERTVHLDGCVEVEAAYYSAPSR